MRMATGEEMNSLFYFLAKKKPSLSKEGHE